MSWESRNGRRYYTRSYRRAGRIVRQYIGGGHAGEVAALIDEMERRRHRAEREMAEVVLRQRVACDATMDRVVSGLYELADAASRAVLIAAGFHNHKGNWRRRRTGMGKRPDRTSSQEGQAASPRPSAEAVELERLLDALRRAQAGDQEALPEVKQFLATNPTHHSALFDGDLANTAENSLLDAMAGKNLVLREAMKTKAELLRKELAGPNPCPLESLLAARVVACWLQAYYADALAAQSRGITFRQGEYNQRRQDTTHRRLLSAVKTLATVRRLALPIKINVNMEAMVLPADREPLLAPPRWSPSTLSN